MGCYWVVVKTGVPSHAEVSSACVLLSFCLEIHAIKATKELQVVRHERVHLNMLHCLNGEWGGLVGVFLPVVVILKLKALQRWLFCKTCFTKLFKIVISSHK